MTAFQLPDLPLSSPSLVFATLMAVVLLAPVLAERVRVPGIIGLVVAGTLIGPGGLGLLQRQGTVAVLGELGLLYLMFLVGLGLDLDEFRVGRRAALLFGALTFAFPMVLGLASSALLGYAWPAAVLLASCWASHTLIAFPIYRRFGMVDNRAVHTIIGGTIVTNVAALLVLAVVVRSHASQLDWVFWATLAPRLAMLLAFTLWALPRLARWFFAGIGHDRSVRFLFVLTGLFVSAAVAELAGVQGLVGAFLAGLALNRLAPNGGVLMERVEFFGSTFLVPIFLIFVGMLVEPGVLFADPGTVGVAAVFLLIAVAGKGLAALTAGRLLGYGRAETGTLFSLSVAQAAATLAAVIVGFDVGLIDIRTVHAVVPVVLVTCLLSTWTANRLAPRLPAVPVRPRDLGEAVLVPVANPDSAGGLVRLAALLARPDSGTVMPLTVVGPEASDSELDSRRELTARAESIALSRGVEAVGLVRIDGSPAAGALHTVVEHRASFMLVGWKGYAGARENLFGSVIDSIVVHSSIPLAVTRLQERPYSRILLCVFAGTLPLSRRPGVQLAAEIARRLHAGTGVPVVVLTDSADGALDDLLRGLDATVTRDQRRQHVVVGDHARPDDLVVVSVSPTETGLRTAATRIAWAAPESSILVALDAGVRRGATPMPDQTTHAWDMWLQP